MRSAAYLAGSSVSLVASAVVGGFAGVVVLAKLGLRRFIALFSPARRAALRAEKAGRSGATSEK